MTGGVNDSELAAYVEGALDPRRAEELRRALADDPGLARRLEAFVEVRRLKKVMFGPMDAPGEPVRLAEAALMPWRPRLPKALAVWVALTATLALAMFVALLLAASQVDPVIAQALQAERVGLPPLAKALSGLPDIGGAATRAPDLARFGLELTGLRADAKSQTAAFQYRDAAGARVTLLVRPAFGRVRFEMTHRGGLRLCIWQDGALTAVLAGPIEAGEMMQLIAASVAGLRPRVLPAN